MPRNNSEGDVESANKDDGPVMKKPKFKDDLKVSPVNLISLAFFDPSIVCELQEILGVHSDDSHHSGCNRNHFGQD